MNKNRTLKLKLWEKGISQDTLSRETGIPRAYISLGVNGRYVFDDQQKAKIARALGLSKTQVFNDQHGG
jgi:cyanate lyase